MAKAGIKRIVVCCRSKLQERDNVKTVDSISGDSINYLNDVSNIVSVMKKDGVYNTKADIMSTYGFKYIMVYVKIYLWW